MTTRRLQLVALGLTLAALTRPVAARNQQIVVQPITGAHELQRTISQILGEDNTLVSPARYREAAVELGALEDFGDDIVAVCEEIGCDAVVSGALRHQRRGYLLELKLHDGHSGELKKRLLLRLKKPRLSDELAQGLKERLAPETADEVDEAPTRSNFREGFDDELETTREPRAEVAARAAVEKSSETTPALGGVFDIAGYYDNRGATDMSITAFVKLPAGFEYFGFVVFQNESENTLIDQNSYFSQQHLFFSPSDSLPIDFAGQFELVSGNDNDAIRVGARWRVSDTGPLKSLLSSIRMSYSVGLYPLQFDYLAEKSYRAFLSHGYFIDIVPGRVYLSGFADHALRLVKAMPAGMDEAGTATAATPGGLKHMIVTEHQLGVRLFAGLHAVAEIRHNPFLDGKNTGVGVGLQYVIPFSVLP